MNLFHLLSSTFPRFGSIHSETYMLSLGNIETAPLTPQAEGKDWIDIPSDVHAPAEVSDRPRTSFTSHTRLRCDRPTKVSTAIRERSLIQKAGRLRMSSVLSSQLELITLHSDLQEPLNRGFCRCEIGILL